MFRNDSLLTYSIRSSIWPGLRPNYDTVMCNSSWQIGSGININFWTATWLSKPLVELLQIPERLHNSLKATVHDFIRNGSWCIPEVLFQKCSILAREINQVTIPFSVSEDHRVWNDTSSGDLSMKDAFCFHNNAGQVLPWCKLIWNKSIPPSKSFILWRAMHNRMPTDENLWSRGCIIVSGCSLCGAAAESTHHLFCSCSFAQKLWNWLGSILNFVIDTSSLVSILSICSRNWSSQLQEVISAAVVIVIWTIWYCRNKLRFDNKSCTFQSAINLIVSNVSLSGNLGKGILSSSIQDLLILRAFNIAGRPIRAPSIIQVNWLPPLCNWTKCNTDGAAKGSPGPAGCGGIFRDHRATFMGCFAANLGSSSALHAELLGAMMAIELAYDKGWHNLWLECDSLLVLSAFHSFGIVPWRLRNRWRNCIHLTKRMSFVFSHIYREGNNCTDKLASLGTVL